jgi:hypothetical protein
MGYSNWPPASHPVRGADQLDQSLGWLEGAKTAVSNPRGGDWVQIGDHSVVGRRLFEHVQFTTGDQAAVEVRGENHMVDRNQTPSSTSIVLSDSEFAKRAAPGGRLPVGTAKSNAYGDKAYTPIHDASAAAVAARAEREHTRERPDLVSRRDARGK